MHSAFMHSMNREGEHDSKNPEVAIRMPLLLQCLSGHRVQTSPSLSGDGPPPNLIGTCLQPPPCKLPRCTHHCHNKLKYSTYCLKVILHIILLATHTALFFMFLIIIPNHTPAHVNLLPMSHLLAHSYSLHYK